MNVDSEWLFILSTGSNTPPHIWDLVTRSRPRVLRYRPHAEKRHCLRRSLFEPVSWGFESLRFLH